jgi:flagellum-specific peptidoglycan hydrolase FlgJ
MRLICFIFLFLLVGERGVREFSPATPIVYPSIEITLDSVFSQPKFTSELLREYIKEKGILHPDIVYAQAVLETGNFTSRIFRESHNLFGMKLPKIRPTVATGERYGHATYCHWKDSVDDYLLWQEMWSNIETEAVYYTLLQRVYAEDQNYTRLVKTIRKRNYEWNI